MLRSLVLCVAPLTSNGWTPLEAPPLSAPQPAPIHPAPLLDGAHVASSLRERLAGFGSPAPVVLALGLDKDHRAVLKALRGVADTVHCTRPSQGAFLTPGELAAHARALGFPARTWSEPAPALAAALGEARPGGWVLVLGSFYLAGELRPALRLRTAPLPQGHPC